MTTTSRSKLFVATFRPAPGVNATRALRRLLKFAWRACGLRCVSVEERAGAASPARRRRRRERAP